jgi:hypothetical protein
VTIDHTKLPPEIWARWIDHSKLLVASFRERVGRELLPSGVDAEAVALRLFNAPMVVVSHGVEADPILNYGNRVALALWEMSAPELVATPSRLTAEPMVRDSRQRLLLETARSGFVDGYVGVRISATGRRFRISNVLIWTVTDAAGRPAGQAATFARWTFL